MCVYYVLSLFTFRTAQYVRSNVLLDSQPYAAFKIDTLT